MTPSPLHETGTSPHGGTSAPELFNYSEDEDDEWMPFRRSAPDLAKAEDGWDLRGFVSPFQGTSLEKIRAIVEAIQVTENDVVFDLGCGDGRFIIECCRLTSCSGVGVELDSSLFARAKRNASRVEGIRASFIQCDFIASTLDLSEATVIFLYLLPEALQLLLPKLCHLARTSTALRCIVSICWALPSVSASIHNAEMNFFIYNAADLNSKSKTPA